MIGRALLLATTTIIAAPVSFAADDGPCAKETAQMGLNECYGNLAEAVDAKLNKLYRALAAKSEGTEKDSLRDAQRAWLAYRDKECDYETVADEGGSIRPMEISLCVAKKTTARIKEFEKFLACATDDKSCRQ
jgi:uncharacterized protein YecT (DUF1311 family)